MNKKKKNHSNRKKLPGNCQKKSKKKIPKNYKGKVLLNKTLNGS